MNYFNCLGFCLVILSNSCASQTSTEELKVGGPCEGCEAIYESPIAFSQLNAIDTLPDFNQPGPKLELTGVIYQRDGRTPASGVVLYIYHTNQAGHYASSENEKGWGKRHGNIRGWVKTNKDGVYKFYTLIPAPYPGRTDPNHIHATIKEPGKSEYYIEEFLFADDPRLAKASPVHAPRCGDGILKLRKGTDRSFAMRSIILGLNIPGYPTWVTKIKSGLIVGTDCPSFTPLHLSGADKGTNVCPMCKYGFGQGVMIWFNHDNLTQMNSFVNTLEQSIKVRSEGKFRVFLVYMNPSHKLNDQQGEQVLKEKIRDWCKEQNLVKTALLWIPSPIDEESCKIFKINPQAKNTILIYKSRKVITNLVDQDYDERLSRTILDLL